MLHHKLLIREGVLIVEPQTPLQAADFEGLTHKIDPYIAEYGILRGLMIYAKAFPGWVNLAAFLAHMRFIENHHEKFQKLAVVSDSKLLTEVPRFAAHLVRADVKLFPESAYAEALRWFRNNLQ